MVQSRYPVVVTIYRENVRWQVRFFVCSRILDTNFALGRSLKISERTFGGLVAYCDRGQETNVDEGEQHVGHYTVVNCPSTAPAS